MGETVRRPIREGVGDQPTTAKPVFHNILLAAAARAQGFTEGIEAALEWHRAEYWRLVVRAEAVLRDERAEDCAEMLNRAFEHARSLPALRALAL